jgi:hypothetical protein
MEIINENTASYNNPYQRELLIQFAGYDFIKENFFLTGGTALAVFYLHHRVSDDLDFFTINEGFDIKSLNEYFKRKYRDTYELIHFNEFILSSKINGTKVDLVIDFASNKFERESFKFENNSVLYLDNLRNIVSNKLTTLVSRTETKDFIDFYFLMKSGYGFDLNSVYSDAEGKDGLFEDFSSIAYMIEEAFKKIYERKEIFPKLTKELDFNDFKNFYDNLCQKIYNLK